MSDHEHHHDEPKAPVPLALDDAGSTALSDALHSSFLIVKILMAGLVVLFFASGFFTVGPQERAVILRFGKPVGEGDAAWLGPGAHWSWPPPIDEVRRIPFTQVQSAESTAGWYAMTPEQILLKTDPPAREALDPARDSYALTGDANIIHVRATLRYRITDPHRFIFGFTNAPGVVTNVLNNAIYFAAGQFTVDDALTRNQVALRERIERRIEQVAAQVQLGITLEQVTLTTKAPLWLKDKFESVSRVAQHSDTVRSEAETYANEAQGRALGEAAARIGVAESDRTRLVEAVKAEAKVFSDALPHFRADREMFMRFRQAEVLYRVYTNADERLAMDEKKDGKRTVWLPMSRTPLKQKPAPEPVKGDNH